MKEYKMKFIPILFLSIFLAACNLTPFEKGDEVTAIINDELKKCGCTVNHVTINQMVKLICDNGGRYELHPSNLIKCGHEYEFDY